uniref:ADAM metallopeptidase with thrombospondin type 1 motif 12 n=1 Tax=Amazona collaria TaxID=241587 RepID=A0A8B9F1K9_9PSIT
MGIVMHGLLLLFSLFFSFFFPFLSEQFIKTLPEYHVVDPARVDASGHFLSFNLHHHISNTRKKRDLSNKENVIHYKINHEDKDLFFNLTAHMRFLSHNYVVERRRGNHTGAKIATHSGASCHFIGTVLQPGAGSGTASISTCNGLTGYFHLPHGDYFIEPIKNHPQKEGTPYPHIVYGATILQNALRRRRAIPMEKRQACGLNEVTHLGSFLKTSIPFTAGICFSHTDPFYPWLFFVHP